MSVLTEIWILLLILVIATAIIVASSITILPEYQRGVIFMLGRFWRVKGPGMFLVIPILQQVQIIDMREKVADVPKQDIITKDNVMVKVNAVIHFRVHDPRQAVIQTADFERATWEIGQSTLRAVVGRHELDQLSEPETISVEIQRAVEVRTETWGVKVSSVDIKEVEIDEQMMRVISRQAEAERVRRAKLIEASGEQQAATAFLDAAEILAARPEAMQLRYLATLNTIANERSATIIFPFPTDLVQMFGSRVVQPPVPAPAPAPAAAAAPVATAAADGTKDDKEDS